MRRRVVSLRKLRLHRACPQAKGMFVLIPLHFRSGPKAVYGERHIASAASSTLGLGRSIPLHKAHSQKSDDAMFESDPR